MTPADLKVVLLDLGCDRKLAERAVTQFFELFDVNNNGKIDFIETCVAMTQLADMTDQDKVKMLFLACDVDKSDTVDRGELRYMLRYLFETRYQLLGKSAFTRRHNDEYAEIPRKYSAQHKANMTTVEVFKAANVKEGGELKYQQFEFWIRKGGPQVEFVMHCMTDPKAWEKSARGKVATMRDTQRSGILPAQGKLAASPRE